MTADSAERARSRFPTKLEATKKGDSQNAVGANGGSVKVQKIDGKFQEELTFPRGNIPNPRKYDCNSTDFLVKDQLVIKPAEIIAV